MLIHTYFTDGFINFGKVFIESFKSFHGEEMPMVVTTRNLSPIQIAEIKGMYKNLIVLNEEIDMKTISGRTKRDIKTLKRYKYEIEYEHINGRGNVVWKQYISVEDRYRNSIVEAMKYSQGEKYMMHIDSDSYVRKSLTPMFNLIMKNDITLIFRLDRPKPNRKIFGSLSGYKLGRKADLFMKTWIKHIDAIPLRKKPIGYGQTSCYLAYKDLENSNIKWGVIPKVWVKSDLNKKSLIWSGNHSRGKTKTAKIFQRELQNGKKE
jgi:hypothetical protein